MKISNIRTYPTRIGGGSQLLVKVETNNGLYGWGASGLSTRELAVAGAIEHFRPFLLGHDPRQIGGRWQEMYRSQYFEGGRVLTAAISAIDIALYDIKGKALGVPVYELLGDKQRDFVDCFASLRFASFGELLDKGKILKEAGWKVMRLAPAEFERQEAPYTFEPRTSILELSQWIQALREALGTEICLGLDYHHRLSIAETISFLQRMPVGTLDFLEEPIRDENPGAYQALRQMTNVPFAIGEEFASKWQFMPYLEQNITQYARLDVCNVGGLSESMKVAAMAETHYIDLMPHNPLGPICTAASIHLAAACPNFYCLEEVNTEAEQSGNNDPTYYLQQPQLQGSRYPVPNSPGLGIEVDEDKVASVDFSLHEVPHMRREDGSYTNW
ncbi:MAG: mandelate racemase/muconate lactonizing enzyme family protein [Bacteroidota bacterium]